MSELNDKLEETKKMLAELQASMDTLKVQKNEVDSVIRAKHREINSLESQRLEIDNQAWMIRRQLAEAEQLMQAQLKAAETQAEKDRIQSEYQKISNSFDAMIAVLPWGNDALPHQKDGAKKLAVAKRAVLGDKRGLGKTLTSIAYTDLVKAKKILAIVPNDVQGNFQREVNMWAPHRSVHIIGGMTKIERSAILEIFKIVPEIFVIVNYEAWRKDNALLEQLIKVHFDTVIVDEAHMIKEMKTNAYRGVERIIMAENECPICGGDNFQGDYYVSGMGYVKKCFDCTYIQEEFGEFCSVKNVLPMTGTPILNKPQDIFPLLHLVNPVVFSDPRSFLVAYCRQNNDGKWVFLPGGEARLASKLAGLYVARNRDQAGVKIPKQSIQVHELELDPALYPKQWEAYQILQKKSALLVNDMLAEEENKAVLPVTAMIALITRERQMAVYPAGITFRHPKTKEILFQSDVTESIKLDYIINPENKGLVPQFVLDEEERVVVFSQFKQPLIELERRIKAAGISVVRYDGDTSKELAQEVQIDFDRRNQDPDKPHRWDVVLCHYKKGGVGLNLNAATQTILLDEEWNPGKEDQAHGRTDRMGQTEETTVHVLRIRNTVDMWMAKLIAAKGKMIEGFETHVDLQQELLDILRGEKKDD